MIAAGVLILLFVAYQLWGTGLAEARSQRALKRSFAQSLAEGMTTTTTTSAAGPPPSTTMPPDNRPPAAPEGNAVAIIKIPKIAVEKAVVEGVDLGLLKQGPGHYPSTPMPGQPGNAAIAGHRTTYGAPFFRLNELDPGDSIFVTTRQGRFRYAVMEKRVVRPDETDVLLPSTDNLLTLTTCNPRFSAAQRLIVIAALQGEATDPPPAAAAPPSDSSEGPSTPSTPPSLTDESLSGRNAANGPAIGWGLVAACVWLLTWLVGRLWRKWPAYLLGTPVFLVVLFIFFENFSRLLPSNF